MKLWLEEMWEDNAIGEDPTLFWTIVELTQGQMERFIEKYTPRRDDNVEGRVNKR